MWRPSWAGIAAAAGFLLLVVGPFREALVTAAAPGTGGDVVQTLWGMWWFQQEWHGAAWGGWTSLVNYPAGALGCVLSPGSAVVWGLADPVLGPGRAASLAALVQIVGLSLGVALLARAAGASRPASAVAALVVLAARYLVYETGHASVVSVAALPLPLGLWGLLGARKPGRRGTVGLAAAAAGITGTAFENPYLAPVLPVCAAIVAGHAAWHEGRQVWTSPAVRRLLGAAALGTVGMLAAAAMFSRSASPDYPRQVAGRAVGWAGLDLQVIELAWARLDPVHLLWPGPVVWLDPADASVKGEGGSYLGLVGAVLAAAAAVLAFRRALPWLALTGAGVALALGSVVGGTYGPFAWLNVVMDAVARPVTQPMRYLVLAVVGLGVCAALGADALARVVSRRREALGRFVVPVAAALVLVDALAAGGLSLRLPSTAIPQPDCLSRLAPQGGALTWPWDAMEGDPSRSQLLQLAHGHPAAHPGIAAWVLSATSSPREVLRTAGWNVLDHRRTPDLLVVPLRALGYRWAIVDNAADPEAHGWLSARLGAPVLACDAWTVFDIGEPTGEVDEEAKSRPRPAEEPALPADAP